MSFDDFLRSQADANGNNFLQSLVQNYQGIAWKKQLKMLLYRRCGKKRKRASFLCIFFTRLYATCFLRVINCQHADKNPAHATIDLHDLDI